MLRNLLIANRVVFKAGGFFTKLWMITMPIFVLYGIFGNITFAVALTDTDGATSLWQTRGDSWPMILFYSVFLFGYPFRNLHEVNRIVKGVGMNTKLKYHYKNVLEVYKAEKNK